ncbi:hypothetical protein HDU83_000682 [Entophlyctis luteolus]|nr:hypothetical protein HDU83_000682 [Entophlyctis luteolus]KAJ3377950.1 hypothetical protein HDU84_008088 [Entophlyctis sp. JEL0112]
MNPAPLPTTPLGFHRVLSTTAGVRVSPLCLGTMNFGDAWTAFLGKCDKTTAFEILDHFYASGGNFVDTANNYQGGESETWLGEWMATRGVRDQIVVATKFTTGYVDPRDAALRSNYCGNHTKSLRLSVEASLKKMQTSYIDLLYVHWWDFSTSIEEVMRSLHALVLSGKVLYLGISDTPAWIVSSANRYARDHALTPFVVYQGRWSAADRDFEREIISMARAEGMALAPWGALGGGKFKSAEDRAKEDGRKNAPRPRHLAVSAVLETIAKRKDTLITSIALAYVMHKAPYVFPIVGGRKVEHIKANIEALSLELSKEDIAEIESAFDFEVGFPYDMLFEERGNIKYDATKTTSDIWLVSVSGHLDSMPPAGPIKPRKL